jgi:D-lactate dehydrogenase (cytochrome)
LLKVSEVMKLCTKYGMTVVPFGGGTSLEGQTLSPYKKGVSIDFKNMREVLELNEKVCLCTRHWKPKG